jgi:hypothetical protein
LHESQLPRPNERRRFYRDLGPTHTLELMRQDIVVVATYPSEVEASIAQASLDSAGIDSIMLRDDAAGIIPSISFLKGVRVAVRAEDVKDARRQLQL